jgi:outer membrane lipoprotein-sorting protein
VILRTLVPGAALALALGVAGGAGAEQQAADVPAFDRLQATWSGVADYSVTIESHEVLGNDTAETELHFAFRRPDRARLDVVKGRRSGGTIVWDGGDRVTAYRRPFSIFKMHASVWDKNLTSLRGNGILNPNVIDILACFAAHRELLRQREGPPIDGKATDEIELPYRDVSCPDDPPADRGTVTLDVIDVDRASGMPVMRKRYQGDEIVERWELTGFTINTGLADRDLS